MKEKTIEVLIIEDNADDLYFIKKAIDIKRFNCRFIASGKEAFEYLLSPEVEPDIVLIDYMLPEMNGLEILDKLNLKGIVYSYIFLTIDNTIKTVVDAMNKGALDFIVKSTTLKEDLPGKIEKVYNLHLNRIQKKRMEDELIKARMIAEENARKYQILVDAAFDSIIVTRAGVILEANKKATEISGFSYSELVGKNALDFTVGDGKEIIRYIKYHEGKDIESKIERKDGKILSVIINSRQSLINEQLVQITSIRDITESRLMEKKLRQSEKMSAIGQLAGGIAHDFNNQLSPIIGYADMLCHQLENPQYKRFAQNILHSAIRSAELTKKLLSFARKGQIILERIDINELLSMVVDIFESGIDKQISVVKEMENRSFTISADSNQLEHAIMNILMNAKDSMEDKGLITVSTHSVLIRGEDELCIFNHLEAGQYIKIIITDTGCGIPDKLKKNIFEPFFTTKEIGKGTGMGLASAYGAIKEHGGYISFTSEEKKGTNFYIYLPLDTDISHNIGYERDTLETDTLRKNKILIVDDEEMLISMLEDFLEKENYNLVSCSNGKEALDIIKQSESPFDLILLDMVMPEMDGYEAFMRMKELDPHIKVVITSGYNMKKEFKKLKEEGVLGFLNKPYKNNQLKKLLKSVLG